MDGKEIIPTQTHSFFLSYGIAYFFIFFYFIIIFNFLNDNKMCIDRAFFFEGQRIAAAIVLFMLHLHFSLHLKRRFSDLIHTSADDPLIFRPD